MKAWTERYMRWLEQVRYTQPAQQVTLRDCLNEVEHMSARAGNEYLRRIVAESAWCQRHWPRVGARLRKLQQGIPAEITAIAGKAQNCLHKRYMKPRVAGKDHKKIMTAVRTGTAGLYLSHRHQGPASLNTQPIAA
jgi:hypothetical protein